MFDLQKLPGFKLFKQPTGLLVDEEGKPIIGNDGLYVDNPEHDNYKHIKNKNYYRDSAIGKDMEYIKVYCLGQYGSLRTGKVVYPDYNDDLHSGMIYILLWDCLCISAKISVSLLRLLWCKFTPRGQLLLLKEYISEDMSINTFCENILIPCVKKRFPRVQN